MPPAVGIVHQVNLEFLAKGVFLRKDATAGRLPDTLVGTDSHTTMINGLGVLGWGVGGIEAEAVMLGQPLYMLTPEVVGFELTRRICRAGATATDLVLTVTQILRKEGVVGKFVEYFGPGIDAMKLADRAMIANMAPEYGATMGFFPVDERDAGLPAAHRPHEPKRSTWSSATQGAATVPHCRARPEPQYSQQAAPLDLGTVEPAWPARSGRRTACLPQAT